WQARSVVERIYWAQGELDVALRINMVEHLEHYLADVLDVHVLIHHHNAFGEHGLAQRPDAVHHLTGVPRIRLANGNDHQVVKHAFYGQVHIHDFRQCKFHQRQEDSLYSFTHPGIFHRRLANDSCCIDWVFAVSDAGEMENR